MKKILKRFERSKIFGVAIIDKDFSKDAMSKTQKVVMDSKRRNATKVASGEIPPQVVQQMKQKWGINK